MRNRVTALVFHAISALLAVLLALDSRPAAADPPVIVQVSAGEAFTCALDNTGGVWCWGMNLSGQLANGSTTESSVPGRIWGMPAATTISAGGGHACALAANARVYCWGANWAGQIGNGEVEDIQPRPTQVLDLRRIIDITAGGGHTCARNNRHRAFCWGENTRGQLGIGSNESFPVRVQITSPNRFEFLVAGDASTCGTNPNDLDLCWGRNFSGMLGDGTTDDTNLPVPVIRDDLHGFAPNANHTCAINGANRVFCWGNNQWGQLGNGTQTRSITPVRLDLRRIESVVTGRYHSCALGFNQRASCWGNNSGGQLGDATNTDRWEPVPVFGSTMRFLHLTAGNEHTCGLATDNTVWCWGENEYGQLGDGTFTDRRRAVQVMFP
jgi:Alpha-tubulin suppressor and related RCC1 domain-containing proteins